MKKILCTLFTAAVVAAMSAVTAFAEDNLVFVNTVYDASPQTTALEKLRNKNTSGKFVINVYGNSKVSA